MNVLYKIKPGEDVTKLQRKTFYVSLCRELIGYGIAVTAYTEDDVRAYAKEYLGRMWCSVYKTPGNMQIIGEVAHVGYDFI